MKLAPLSALLLTLACVGSAAEPMKLPRVTSAQVDWPAVAEALAGHEALQIPENAAQARTGPSGVPAALRPPLARLNAAMANRFPGIAQSPVPVLLPFDVTALLRDQAQGVAATDPAQYLSGFHASTFFYPGPSGYDAAFAIQTRDIPELADIKHPEPIRVQISGSVLLYHLDGAAQVQGSPVSDLEASFPGIRRMIHEHRLRYTFVRFGVPYTVQITCIDAGVTRYRMPTCRAAEQVAMRFLRALQIAGGTPQRTRPIKSLPIERPAKLSQSFTYFGPGQLLPDTTFRGRGGRPDHTVYSQIRFPLADAPAFANSQMYQSRNRTPQAEPGVSPNYAYPWRDNFCERRGFSVGQCPAGIGHQGQDIRTPQCRPAPGQDRCEQRDDLVAVRGGVILREPQQEAAYLIVNSASEHIRFRYLHMHPRKMDEDNLLSGRRVHEGEVIGQMSNYSKKEGGTSYHLHFDVQVPTQHGWVFVNPYMTLVAAYERLIGERGVELSDPASLAVADEDDPPAAKSRARGASRAAWQKQSQRAKVAKRAPQRQRSAASSYRSTINCDMRGCYPIR
ncbi:MAG: M23 family peptidase [Alphaproteobacteria bacterium]|nr:M23 family peptidase [Alphaproteobacteria bacterium]